MDYPAGATPSDAIDGFVRRHEPPTRFRMPGDVSPPSPGRSMRLESRRGGRHASALGDQARRGAAHDARVRPNVRRWGLSQALIYPGLDGEAVRFGGGESLRGPLPAGLRRARSCALLRSRAIRSGFAGVPHLGRNQRDTASCRRQRAARARGRGGAPGRVVGGREAYECSVSRPARPRMMRGVP